MVLRTSRFLPHIIEQIWKRAVIYLVLSCLMTWAHYRGWAGAHVDFPEVTVSLLGAALGIVLGFRTNSAYNRWWEARTLWGGLVNNSRNLARQAISFFPLEAQATARKIVHLQIAYIHSLRTALRRQELSDASKSMLSAEELDDLRGETNVPAALLLKLGRTITNAANRGQINEWRLQSLDSTLCELTNLQGACERIKNTPLPKPYDYCPRFFMHIYCMLLPLVLVDRAGLATPIVALLASSIFLMLNQMGKNLEDPFEGEIYDVPLSSLTRTIEINLRQHLDEKELPRPVREMNGVIW